MAKKKFDETFEHDEDVKINPESEEEMDNEKAFYDEDKAEELDDLEDFEEFDKEDLQDENPDDGKEKKTGIKGKIARHKKGFIIGGIVAGVLIVGGVVVYKAGKKPVKMDALDEITDILKDKSSDVADVIDFADAVKTDKAV